MKILIDIGHPAHYFNYKNFILYLENNNHNVYITIRNKDVLSDIMLHDKIKFIKTNEAGSNTFKLIFELFSRTFHIYKIIRKKEIDVLFGSINAAYVSKLINKPSFIYAEDDDNIIPFLVNFGYPFFKKIIMPNVIRFKRFPQKRVFHNSYHELAYLHPNNFTPDENILKKYNLEKKKYVILRLNSLKAHHDVGAKGISNELYTKIKEILKDYTIIESKENSKTHQIEPWDMHHVLSFAKMIICDSQTMAAEAMVLGTPSIRINTFVGRISYLEELENKYNLGYGYLPIFENEEKILKTINYLITDKEIEELWHNKRQIMLSEKCDLNQWMINYFEKEINKN